MGMGARAQLYVGDRGVVALTGGAVICVQGDVESRAEVQGAGTVVLAGSALQRVNMHGYGLPGLRVENPAGVVLDGDLRMRGGLVFAAGRMQLGAANLYLSTVSGYDRERFIVTDGMGMLVQSGLGADGFVFPVGRDDGSYRPIRLTQNGTADEVGVRAMPGALTGFALNIQYEVKSFTPGNTKLGMDVAWEPGDELPGFDRSRACILWTEEGTATNGPVLDGGRWGGNVAGVTRTGIFSIASAGAPEASRVYPNPAITGFFVEVGGTCVLQLFDPDGKLVQSRNAAGGVIYFQLGRGYAEGVYVVRILREGGVAESRKIWIKK